MKKIFVFVVVLLILISCVSAKLCQEPKNVEVVRFNSPPSKWYTFNVLDKKHNMIIKISFEDYTDFYSAYSIERYTILDTLEWGVIDSLR
jgi:hypothetical protein